MGSARYELMSVSVKLASLTQGHWYEYPIRFVLGGAMTATAGWIASKYGPVVGGLFLAFPAIFPASATLVEKHEREKKEKAGLHGKRRGKEAAALEAAGSVMGSAGLMAFGTCVWLLGAHPFIALATASIAWVAVSVGLWACRKHIRKIHLR
jgi:hypothetical protein